MVGVVFGWLLAHTALGDARSLAETSWNWQSYTAVLAAVVGGAGIDYLFKTSYVPYFWIGIFVGFFSDIALRFTHGIPVALRNRQLPPPDQPAK